MIITLKVEIRSRYIIRYKVLKFFSNLVFSLQLQGWFTNQYLSCSSYSLLKSSVWVTTNFWFSDWEFPGFWKKVTDLKKKDPLYSCHEIKRSKRYLLWLWASYFRYCHVFPIFWASFRAVTLGHPCLWSIMQCSCYPIWMCVWSNSTSYLGIHEDLLTEMYLCVCDFICRFFLFVFGYPQRFADRFSTSLCSSEMLDFCISFR